MREKEKRKKVSSANLLTVKDLALPESFDMSKGNRPIQISGSTCTICSDCCLCETGGV